MSQKCGSVPELVSLILSFVAGAEWRKGETLVSCALVSRRFSACALAELWSALRNGLKSLWRLLPSSLALQLVSAAPGASQDRIYVLVGPILDEEWARFTYYANFVSYVYCGTLKTSIDSFALSALIDHAQGQPFLPRLQTLSWDQELPGPYIFPFLTNSLRSFHLKSTAVGDRYLTPLQDPGQEEYAAGAGLQLVQTKVPSLEALLVGAPTHLCVLRSVALFRQLRRLTLEYALSARTVVQHCAGLEHLASLTLRFPPGPDPDPLDGTHDIAGFFALEELRIKGRDVQISTIVGAVGSAHLRVLIVEILVEEHVLLRLDVDELVAAAASRWSSSLRTLRLTVDAMDVASTQVFSSFFRSLYAVSNLTDVRFRAILAAPWVFTADDFEAISTAWPKVQTLALDIGLFRGVPPRLEWLELIAARCAELEELLLDDLDFGELISADPEATNWQPTHPPSRSVKQVEIKRSKIPEEQSERCAEYMRRLFPTALFIDFDDGASDDYMLDDE